MPKPAEPLVLAVDAGTSSLKAGVLDAAGKLVAYSRIPIASADGAVWDPGIWPAALKQAIFRLGEPARRVQGMSISGNGPTVIPLDAAGRPTAAAMPWLDSREERVAGLPSFYLPKVAYFRRHMADRFSRTRLFLPCPEFIAWSLTGEAVTITPSNEFLPYIWDGPGLEAYGLDAACFPPVLYTAEAIGTVNQGAAEAFGLARGLPVFAGGADFLMSLVGTDTTAPGRVCDRAGTSEGVNYCRSEPSDDVRLRCLPHAVPGLYNVAAVLASTGRLFEWFRSISGQTTRPHDIIFAEISKAATGRDLPRFFPSVHSGARWEFSRGLFAGLGAEHGRPEMGWAVVESIGYAVREAVEILESADCRFQEVRLSGGQAKNDRWNQMKANLTGKRLLLPRIVDAELTGNLACALVGLGVADDLAGAAARVFEVAKVYEPEPGAPDRFTEGYRAYRDEYARRIIDSGERPEYT